MGEHVARRADFLRFTFHTPDRMIGFALNHSRSGGVAHVDTRNFLSSEDGTLLISRLEQISAIFLRGRELGIRESQIETLLAVLHQDGRVEVVINELNFRAKAWSKRSVQKGQSVLLDDLVDIDVVEAVGLHIPDDAGYVLVFSVGWQRGLLYDFSLLHDLNDKVPRDLTKALGAAFSYLMFRDRFEISDAEWSALIAQRWFPFASLPHNLLGDMINHARASWSVDELLPRIVEHVRANLPGLRDFVKNNPVFQRHRTLILQAIDSYERREYEIVVQALFSRIEGLFRDHAAVGKTGYKDLAASVSAAGDRQELSLLMPARFRDYVTSTLFAPESFATPAAVTQVTRHSVSHGVITESLLDEKNATLALLIFQHLGFIFRSQAKPEAEQPTD